MDDKGRCELVLSRGPKSNKKKAGGDEEEGGEKSLGIAQLPNIGPGQWHNLKLRFEGSKISAFVDEKQVLTATDSTYSHGMAGLMAGSGKKELSTPYYDNLLVNSVGAPTPESSRSLPGQVALYPAGP
jgi:galactosylceramidase